MRKMSASDFAYLAFPVLESQDNLGRDGRETVQVREALRREELHEDD